MTTPQFRRPSLSLVISLVALLVALTATAQALPGKNTVESNDIRKNAVTAKKIKAGAVTTKKIKAGAVTSSKLAPGSVTPAALADTMMWAIVLENGVIAQGVGVDAVSREAPGIYAINFDRPVTNRALSATIVSDGTGSGAVNVFHCDVAHVLGGCSFEGFNGPASVLVNTESADTGGNADRRFLVIAHPTTPGVQDAVLPRMVARGDAR